MIIITNQATIGESEARRFAGAKDKSGTFIPRKYYQQTCSLEGVEIVYREMIREELSIAEFEHRVRRLVDRLNATLSSKLPVFR